MNDETILGGIEPELTERLLSRRDLIARSAKRLGAAATAPLLLTGCAVGAAGGLPNQVVDALNFALTLEYLEDEFYRTGLSRRGLIPAGARPTFAQISKHETAHVALLRSALGSRAVAKPNFDFTAGGAFGDVFSNFRTFAALAQAFEDTGVRAYKGQAGNLQGSDTLTTALQIHSVEARHAAQVRKLRGQKGWITGSSRGNMPAATQLVYNGEGQRSQAGIPINSVGPAAATEAFDEPLSKQAVLQIASLFLA